MAKFDVEEMVFSCISGYNYYAPSVAHAGGYIHIPSETDVNFVKAPHLDELSIQMKWRHFVEWPADMRYFIWPMDIVKDKDGDYDILDH